VATLSIFVFALQYTGRRQYASVQNVLLLSLVPLVTNVLVWTNAYEFVCDHVRVVAPAGDLIRLDVAYARGSVSTPPTRTRSDSVR